jgi:hypothetical protein
MEIRKRFTGFLKLLPKPNPMVLDWDCYLILLSQAVLNGS